MRAKGERWNLDAAAKPKGTVSGSNRGRVLDRANRMAAKGDNRMGIIPRAQKSLKQQSAAVRAGKTRKANLAATPLAQRSKSFQSKRAKAGVARALAMK